jgi:hypothetical protein
MSVCLSKSSASCSENIDTIELGVRCETTFANKKVLQFGVADRSPKGEALNLPLAVVFHGHFLGFTVRFFAFVVAFSFFLSIGPARYSQGGVFFIVS